MNDIQYGSDGAELNLRTPEMALEIIKNHIRSGLNPNHLTTQQKEESSRLWTIIDRNLCVLVTEESVYPPIPKHCAPVQLVDIAGHGTAVLLLLTDEQVDKIISGKMGKMSYQGLRLLGHGIQQLVQAVPPDDLINIQYSPILKWPNALNDDVLLSKYKEGTPIPVLTLFEDVSL